MARRPAKSLCKRTGLPVAKCECAVDHPDLTQPLSPSERQRYIDLAAERDQSRDQEES